MNLDSLPSLKTDFSVEEKIIADLFHAHVMDQLPEEYPSYVRLTDEQNATLLINKTAAGSVMAQFYYNHAGMMNVKDYWMDDREKTFRIDPESSHYFAVNTFLQSAYLKTLRRFQENIEQGASLQVSLSSLSYT